MAGIATSFLVGGQFEVLDSLLSVLIGGEWRRLDVGVPGKRLFQALLELARVGEWEDRRRIAEAAPALALIDREATIPILKMLRDDYDSTRYRSDVRRRVVEALLFTIRRSKPLLLLLHAEELEFSFLTDITTGHIQRWLLSKLWRRSGIYPSTTN